MTEAAALYHRLVLVVTPAGGGKTTALRSVAEQTGAALININVELAQRLLALTQRQRSLQLPRILRDVISAAPGDVVLLDNTEVLFDASLQVDPLRCLQGLSRNRTLVVAWNGTATKATDGLHHGSLIYAEPDHAEYRQYPANDLIIVTPPED